MAGPVSQSESDIVYRRLQNSARALLGVYEEVKRLRSLDTSLDLATNLDPHSGGEVVKADAIALFGALTSFETWFENHTVAFEGTDGGPERRARIDPFLLPENL